MVDWISTNSVIPAANFSLANSCNWNNFSSQRHAEIRLKGEMWPEVNWSTGDCPVKPFLVKPGSVHLARDVAQGIRYDLVTHGIASNLRIWGLEGTNETWRINRFNLEFVGFDWKCLRVSVEGCNLLVLLTIAVRKTFEVSTLARTGQSHNLRFSMGFFQEIRMKSQPLWRCSKSTVKLEEQRVNQAELGVK